MTQFTFKPIGHIRSCFKEKFGIPRQPGLAPDALAVLEFIPPYNRIEAFRGLEEFSHLWITFVFHEVHGHAWSPTVRPPRLGGNRRIGLYASRSPFRPNPIGLSSCRLIKVEHQDGAVRIELGGIDLLDGTPVLDIKPYLPYADSHPDASCGYASQLPDQLREIRFSATAEKFITSLEAERARWLRRLISQVLCNDPRPAYQRDITGRVYGVRLEEFNVRWSVLDDAVTVLDIEHCADSVSAND